MRRKQKIALHAKGAAHGSLTNLRRKDELTPGDRQAGFMADEIAYFRKVGWSIGFRNLNKGDVGCSQDYAWI